MVLNHLPGNTGDVGCLPRKHVDIRTQEGDERAFLFAVEGGAYGEGPSRATLPGGYLLGLRWLGSGFLAPAAEAPGGKKKTGKTSRTHSGKRTSSKCCATVEDVPESSTGKSKKSRAKPPQSKKGPSGRMAREGLSP